ncbi:DUF1064 domain-containing protein [bacterium AH-315-I18]|nr:DUF1064 domain-containing protein [Phycisphaeraceae bacterium]MBN4061089.1 DUF1064 domain-containing protein [bacterium AH-315-I18]
MAYTRIGKSKFNVSAPALRTWNGKTYDSKAEMEFARQLDFLQESGNIIEYIEQPKVYLGARENSYKPDFFVVPKDGLPYYVDVKGCETGAFIKNKKLWSIYGRLHLKIIKKQRGGFRTVEVVVPGEKLKKKAGL